MIHFLHALGEREDSLQLVAHGPVSIHNRLLILICAVLVTILITFLITWIGDYYK
jgi:hypothetical protein